ncbi:MAG: hypothetical protein CM1200mP39_14690 [Dehalococcoidia bacterium]|nr:MAG: hypothetical protein CM1200mP39_14690 [Dehalococcoidia bacterium]
MAIKKGFGASKVIRSVCSHDLDTISCCCLPSTISLIPTKSPKNSSATVDAVSGCAGPLKRPFEILAVTGSPFENFKSLRSLNS